MRVAANDDDWAEVGPRYRGANPLDGDADDRALEVEEPTGDRANEPSLANVAAGVFPTDARPQRAQAHEPGRLGRPAEAAVDACRVLANPAPLNGYPELEVLTCMGMEGAPDGRGDLGAREVIGIGQPAASTCA